MTTRISWSMQRALGITDEEARNAEIRANRIEEAQRPDGAREYVPVSEAGAQVQAARLGVARHQMTARLRRHGLIE